jgi:hypothetical protein
MRVSDHRFGDYDLETGDRLPFLRPDKIKRLSVRTDMMDSEAGGGTWHNRMKRP